MNIERPTTADDETSPTPPHTLETRPFLTSVAAHLYVRDLKASIDFFIGKLGFQLDFAYGEPPFYGQVHRDNALLALRQLNEALWDEAMRQEEQLLSASITLASAVETRELFEIYRKASVAMAQQIRAEPWRALTFVVRDPDGNLILFAGPAD
jgi:catechol 2,3-dioxygenase-like lactoylglutathione lyase family enzyme